MKPHLSSIWWKHSNRCPLARSRTSTRISINFDIRCWPSNDINNSKKESSSASLNSMRSNYVHTWKASPPLCELVFPRINPKEKEELQGSGAMAVCMLTHRWLMAQNCCLPQSDRRKHSLFFLIWNWDIMVSLSEKRSPKRTTSSNWAEGIRVSCDRFADLAFFSDVNLRHVDHTHRHSRGTRG